MSKKVNLKDFIDDHYRLIATIGVFGALTAFFGNLEGFQDIAFLPLMISFVLMWELMDCFPEIEVPLKTSVKTLIFFFLMIILFIAVGWYILVTYVTAYYRIFVVFALLGLYSLIFVKIEMRIRLFKRIHSKVDGELYGFIRFILILVIFGVILVATDYSADFIISLIETSMT